jgi:WD40 repeat protein/tRNA A-37 threonylcarbamoyl transferase component Bud32
MSADKSIPTADFTPRSVPENSDPNRETASSPATPDPLIPDHATVEADRTTDRTTDTLDHSTHQPTPAGPGEALPEIPGYEVEVEIARGGMGVVYRARHRQLNRLTAIKMLLGGRYHDPAARTRFLIEAEAVAALDHPNVVHVHEFGTHDNLPFFALEYVAGGTLAHKLKREGKCAPRAAAELLVKLTDGMAAAHAKGIVHRDLKPGNILLSETGEPKIADFGLAKVGQSDMTATGVIMGTPRYMAPEQAAGRVRDVGTHTDTYALGAILYELLTGQPPFKGDSDVGTLDQVRTRDPARPRAIDPSVPRDLETIALKCLQKEPARRYASVSALGADLRAHLDGKPISARPTGTAERAWKWVKRNPVVAVLLGAVAVSLLAGASAAYANYQDARTQERIANDRANDAAREAAEAKRLEGVAAEKAADADREATEAKKQKGFVEQKALDLAAQLKESRRLLDLNKLRSAQTAFDNNAVALARNTLAEIALENRCVVWGLLARRFEGSLFVLDALVAVHVTSVALSADGSWIVTGSDDNIARVWDARTGQFLAELRGHTGKVTSAAMSTDGTRIVTGSADRTARVWNAGTGQTLTELKGHTGPVTSVALSADGSRIVTGSEDRTARVWEIPSRLAEGTASAKPEGFGRTGRSLTELKHKDEVVSVAISGDGSRVITAAYNKAAARDKTAVVIAARDRTARVWDAKTGQKLLELGRHQDGVTSVAFSADGRHIVTGSEDKSGRVWDAADGWLEAQLMGHTGPVTSIALSADGSRIVTGSEDRTVRVWEGRLGQPLAQLTGHTGGVLSVALSADGARIVTGAQDGTARVWDGRTGYVGAKLKGTERPVLGVGISADGSCIVTTSGDSRAWVWDASSGRCRAVFWGSRHGVGSVAISADGSRIAAAAPDGTARVWATKTGQPLAELTGHADGVTGVALSANGARAVTGSADRTARVWDARTGQSLIELKGHTAPVTRVALSGDGTRIVTGSGDRTARVWDAGTGQSLIELKWHTGAVVGVALSANGARVATAPGNAFNTALVWEIPSAGPERFAPTGRILAELKGHTSEVTSVALSADGARVVTGARDGTVRVWDATTGQSLIELKGHTKSVTSLALSADGSRIVTGSDDQTALVWDAKTGQPRIELTTYTSPMTSAAVSPDGLRVVTGSKDHRARVWNAKTGHLLLELKGHPAEVVSVAFSVNGARIVTRDAAGTTLVWDCATGTRVEGEPVPALAGNGNRTPDGKYAFVPGVYRVVQVPTQLAEDERLRRLWLTRPDPDWHIQREVEQASLANPYGAALHLSAQYRARGVLALEAGDLDRAWGYFILAAAVKPKPPPLAPPRPAPPALIPPAK